jgi:hypothetical protein
MQVALEAAMSRLDRRLEAVREPEMRRALLLEWLDLCSGSEASAAASLVLATRRATDPLRRALCEVLTGVPGSRLCYEHRKDLYAEAAARGDNEVMRMLRTIPAREEVAEPERLLSRELVELPLGRRRALAKSNHPEWLEQLARDCDPIVIANLLNNPRTVLADVVRIAAARPVAAAVLVEISRSPRWSSQVPVRRALARNPYSPVEIATGIVATLKLEDLRSMRGDPDLHPETRAQLEAELARRAQPGRSS